MRITNNMIAKNLLATLNQNRERIAELRLDLATTKKIRKPSDDPAGTLEIARFEGLISRNEQYLKNITQITGFISNASTAVDSVTDLLENTKEIAIQGASDTLDATTRQSLANNVDKLIDDLVDLGNSKFKDRFIFAGTLTRGSKPFTRTGDVVSYNGNNKDLKGKIGIESEIIYNKTGLDVFNPPGGVDIFATLAALKQGLESNDPTAIENSMTPLDKAIKQTLSNSAEFGILQNKLDLTVQIIEKEKINYADFMSKIQDTDIAETIVNYQMLENALNSGLKTMAEIVRTSLVDFIA